MGLDDEILRLLGDGPQKAAEIARLLKRTREAVNSALYGSLKGRVIQDKTYLWHLASENGSERKMRPDIEPNKRVSLFRYYIDCLAADAGVEVSVFASGKHDLDYVQLNHWPFQADTTIQNWRDSSVEKLMSRQRRDSKTKTLWFGWPVLIRRMKSKKSDWEGGFVEPLLLWPVESDGDHPQIGHDAFLNSKALERLVGDGNAMEEAAQLAEELGLDEADEIDFADLAERLHAIRPDWPWLDRPAPTLVGDAKPLSDPDIRAGILNAAVIALADRQPFTAGLERELLDLQGVTDADIDASALGCLLGVVRPHSEPFTKPILEAAPLNAEQREAVRSALSRPLSVITGPPGTGKSQVVTAIIVNAAYHGMNVLFASKNNQAVDVVEERVNGLTTRPVLLRLGGKSFQATLADKLTTILSARVDSSQRETMEQANLKVATAASALAKIDETLESTRVLWNRAALVEQQTVPTRLRLGEDAFKSLAGFDPIDTENRLKALVEAYRSADRQKQGLFVGLFWPVLKNGRAAHLATVFRDTQPLLQAMGVRTDDIAVAITQFPDAFERAKEVSLYHDLRHQITSKGDASELARERMVIQQQLAVASTAAFEGWLAALGERLSRPERESLGDYTALLRTIAAANEDDGQIAKAVWANYYKLAAKAAKAFPGWAVTSLSARGRIPFASAQFDLVVIDEASQCDIASVLPLLFRGKRAAIIGDPEQLTHISRLSDQQDQGLMVRHGILDNPGAGWSYRSTSLYALAASRVEADAVIALRDHHRSHDAIIQFSNREFYGGALRVATDYKRLKRAPGDVVRWIDVKGDVIRPRDGGAVNDTEAKAVVAELRRMVLDQKYGGSIGVVTPFRAQGRRIRELVSQDPALHTVLSALDFLAEVVHKYQGDERDVMIFSPVVSNGLQDGARHFLERNRSLFNVAITRARAALVVVGDRTACATSGVLYLERFVTYLALLENKKEIELTIATRELDYPKIAQPELVSDWERKFYRALAAKGVYTIPQYPVDQYLLDLALVEVDGRRLDIEVDGERYHRDPWTGEHLRRDQLRDMRLMEMGWDIRRFWVAEVRDNLEACVAKILEWRARTVKERH